MSLRVRGTSDLPPGPCREVRRLERGLLDSFAEFGYQQVDFPLLEHTELYLKKGAEESLPFLFDFRFANRRLCLRPEMTTSALRLYVENLQHQPRPQRLSFSGPVFRYEKPQRGRSRQFTLAGVELIGARGPMADAEVIGLACHSLRTAGLEEFQVVIGHLGILTRFLKQLKLEPRMRRMLLIEQELLRTEGVEALVRRLRQTSIDISDAGDQPQKPAESRNGLAVLLSGLSREQAYRAVMEMLQTMEVDLTGNREPAEIVDRLLNKLERPGLAAEISRAVDFMRELSALTGTPAEVLQAAAQLAAYHGIDGRSTLNELHALMRLLETYEVDRQVRLDLGMSRGVPYYTGFLMEIHPLEPDSAGQLCGGGRYDGLVAALGAREPAGAVGVSFGVERLHLALTGADDTGTLVAPRLLVVGVGRAEREEVIRVAGVLRRSGIRTEIDVRGRSVTRNLQYANRIGIPWVAILGAREKERGTILLKQMATGRELDVPVQAADRVITEQQEEIDAQP